VAGQGRGAHPLRQRPVRHLHGGLELLGQPAAAVPAGLDEDRLPTAVQIAAPAGRETRLLSLAAQLEQARPWADRRPPIS
jgi:Asp-tRNA(Asn)/Glu-tRNA(Gln) amidotransferase A subunit family amidase